MKILLNSKSILNFVGKLILVVGSALWAVTAGHSENQNPGLSNFSINIQQTTTNANWETQKTSYYIGDTVVEINGKICGAEGKNKKLKFSPQWGGYKADNFHYTAKLINDGNGFVVVKNVDGDEYGGISEIHLENFELKNGCCEEKQLSFKSRPDAKWDIVGWDLGSIQGGLYISKDRSLILKAPMGINQETGELPSGVSKYYVIYSVRNLQPVEKGYFGGKVSMKIVRPDMFVLILHGVEYELITGLKSFDINKNSEIGTQNGPMVETPETDPYPKVKISVIFKIRSGDDETRILKNWLPMVW